MRSYTTFSLGNLRLAQDKIEVRAPTSVPVADLAYHDTAKGWIVEPGKYDAIVGRHSLAKDRHYTHNPPPPAIVPKPVQLGPGGATLDGSSS